MQVQTKKLSDDKLYTDTLICYSKLTAHDGKRMSLLDLQSFIHIKEKVKRETHGICQGRAEKRGKQTPEGPLETWI